MRAYRKRAAVAFLTLLLFALVMFLPIFPWSHKSLHAAKKTIRKFEMKLSAWRGKPARVAAITGRLTVPGARVEAIDSRSGWASFADRQGLFCLPGVIWYPRASYDLIVYAGSDRVKRFTVTAPADLTEGAFDVGELDFDQGAEVADLNLPGINSVSFTGYDSPNEQLYKSLFAELTSHRESDEEKLAALNSFVATRNNYEEDTWSFESVSQVLERGSRYCGNLSLLMATIAEAGNYRTRIVDVTDGASVPTTHVVVEVYYDGAWHLYDPTFGIFFRDREGRVAAYKDLRLDTGLVSKSVLRRLKPDLRPKTISSLMRVYGSSFHHISYFKKRQP